MDIVASVDYVHETLHVEHRWKDTSRWLGLDDIEHLREFDETRAQDDPIAKSFADGYWYTVFVEEVELPKLIVAVISKE